MSSWTGCLSVPETFQIPEHDEAMLRAICRIPPVDEGGGDLPTSIIAVYRRMKRSVDIQGCPMDGAALACVVTLASYLEQGGVPEPNDPKPTFLDAIAEHGIKPGFSVRAIYRNKERLGTFAGVTNQNRILVDIEGEERELDPKNVWLPSPD